MNLSAPLKLTSGLWSVFFATSLLIILLDNIQVNAQEIIGIDFSKSDTIRLDPSHAGGGTVSEIFETIKYIPLQTTKESLFGSIGQLEVTEKYFIIYDSDTNCILIFGKDGRFHAKIKGKPAGTGNRIKGIVINSWKEEIVYTEDGFKHLNFVDFNGNLIKVVDGGILKKNRTSPSVFAFMGPDKVLSYQEYTDFDTLSNDFDPTKRTLLSISNNFVRPYLKGMEYNKFEGRMEILGSGVGPLTPGDSDSTFFFSKPYDYSIYKITPGSIYLKYKFIIPSSISLPADFTRNEIFQGKRFEWIDKHNDVIFSINNFYQIGSNIFFETSIFGNFLEDNLIYNLKSGNLLAFKHIAPDGKNFHLPIYTGDPDFENLGLTRDKAGYIYTSLSSLAMFNAEAENRTKQISYPPSLSTYFSTGKKSNNPVIIQIKVKENL
jgi:hypothetical protein